MESHETRYVIRCVVCRARIGYDNSDEDETDVCDDCADTRIGYWTK